MNTESVIERIEKIRKKRRAEYRVLAGLTGMTIKELDADLTAPDPTEEDKDDK